MALSAIKPNSIRAAMKSIETVLRSYEHWDVKIVNGTAQSDNGWFHTTVPTGRKTITIEVCGKKRPKPKGRKARR